MKTLANSLAVSLLLFGWTGLSQAQYVKRPAPAVHNVSIANDDGTISTFPMVMPMMGLGGGDQTHLFRDPSVIKDLELVDEQIEAINRLLKSHYELMQKEYAEHSKAREDPDRIKELRAAVTAMRKSHQNDLSDVLLPHQRDRLKQVALQIQIAGMGGSAAALQDGQFGADLNISEAQKKKFAEISQELQKEIAAKTAELKKEARKKVMAELTAEQKSKLEAMTGEKFKRDQNDWKEYTEKRRAEAKKRQSKDR